MDCDAYPHRVRYFVHELDADSSRLSDRGNALQAPYDSTASGTHGNLDCAVRRVVAAVNAKKRTKITRDA